MLGAHRGSRLYRELVRQRQIASAATAFTFDLAKGSDLLVLDITARPGVAVSDLESAVATVVDGMRVDGPAPGELERAQAIVETEFLSAMQGVGDRADRLSQFATYFGSPERVNEQISRYRAVTLDEVRTFVNAALGPDNRASLMYVPRESA
jgi:predicted Zn-dependent peptidase